MILTNENYHSVEANKMYFSTSQFKNFCECENMALASINGEYEREPSTAFLVGSYVDAHFSGTLDLFRARHPEILKKDGDLKSEYTHAETVIQRAERDEMFMRFMDGEKQVILTGEWLGVPWRVMIDSYHPKKAVVDLKVMKDFDSVYMKEQGRITFVEAYGYDLQGAIYTAIEGNSLPFYLAAATKEKPEPDIAVMQITQPDLDTAAQIIKLKIDRFAQVKAGQAEPVRCGRCDYCKRTKVLTEVVDFREICE
jgi:hypothetical protein